MSNKAPIGLFYGSTTCYTQMAAEKIQTVLGDALVDLYDIAEEAPATMMDYSLLILGIPTWDYGELQEDWEEIWDELDELEWHGRKVAIYGLGDQVGYPEWFQDALGYLHHKVKQQGAELVGYWPSAGYEFESSKALSDDASQFVGLPLDEESQFDQTEQRVAGWCAQILTEFGLADA